MASLEAECAKLRYENDKLRASIERREVCGAILAPVDGEYRLPPMPGPLRLARRRQKHPVPVTWKPNP